MSEEAATFVGSARHPKLGDDSVQGRIQLTRWQLEFRSSELDLNIPLLRLEIRLDPTAGGRVSFFDPSEPNQTISSFDLQILDHPALLQQTHTRAQLQNFHAFDELKRRIKLTVLVLGGFALVAMLASALMGMMVRSLAAKVPPEFERKLGDKAMADLRQKGTFLDDRTKMLRLTNAVAPLLAAVGGQARDFRFYILDDPQPNAFALPGGQVVVTTGLMDLAQTPAELAAVVAHELAHLRQHHMFRQIISSAGPYLVCRLFLNGKEGVLPLLGASSQLLVRQSFSQEFELEADSVGWDYLVSAHIDPRASITMLRKMERLEAHEPADFEPKAFSSHPTIAKRIRRLEDRWRRFQGKSAFEPAGSHM